MSKTAGLSDIELACLKDIFKHNPLIEVVKVYGSRAKGNFDQRSDLDLVAFGDELSRHDIAEIKLDIEDSDILYLVDLSLYNDIANNKLREHIDRVGVPIYRR